MIAWLKCTLLLALALTTPMHDDNALLHMLWFIANFNKIKLVTPIPSLNYLKQAWPLEKCGMLNQCLALKCDERSIPSLHATGFKRNYSGYYTQYFIITWMSCTSVASECHAQVFQKWMSCTNVAKVNVMYKCCKSECHVQMNVMLLTETKKWTFKPLILPYIMRRIYVHSTTSTKNFRSQECTTQYCIFKCYKLLKLIYLRNWREVQPFAMDMTPSSVTRTHLSCKIMNTSALL